MPLPDPVYRRLIERELPVDREGGDQAGQGLPCLVLVYHSPSFFRVGRHLREAFQGVLTTATSYFGFGEAHLLLLRSGHKPTYLVAGKPSERGREVCLACLQGRAVTECNPAAATNLPMILRAGDPVGVIEVGIFLPETEPARVLLHKVVPLARHLADLIQDSLFRRQKESHLRRLAVWLETVSAISSTLDLKQVLHLVTQLAADLLRGRCSILLLDEETQTLIPEVAVGAYDPVLKRKFKGLRGRAPFPAIIRALRTQRPVVVTPENMDELIPRDVAWAFELQWTVIAPIMIRDRGVGVMQVDRPPCPSAVGAPFSREEIEIIAAMAKEAGVALENAQLVEALARKEQTLHHLVNKIITAQEDERKRVAGEIHDGAIQALLGIWYRLQRLTSQLDSRLVPGLAAELEYLRDELGRQIQDIRRIVYNLRPFILDNYGLVPAIQAYIENLQTGSGPAIELVTKGAERRLPVNVEITLYRVLQEALANAIKHAQARRIRVELNLEDKAVTLEVADDGLGFVTSARARNQDYQHLGLVSIEERVHLVGGTCEIRSRPGRGTTVRVSIPLSEGHEEVGARLGGGGSLGWR
ncbi:MAG: ATP-binding protein [Moorellales bacterium]